ncbi:MAG: NlpC/P60 family protein [Candidatus Zixiibacteriota bacterium]
MKFAAVIIALVFLSGCTPSPRFVKQKSVRSEERKQLATGISTNEYLRLGVILQKYLGRPYHDRFDSGSGMDCSEFTREVYREYLRREFPRTVMDQYASGIELRRGPLQFGDLVFFETERERISHVGIYIDNDQFIHASSSEGVIISYIDDSYWGKRYVGARRIIGTDTR